ncbi:MAG: DNA-directed RNA polymerase subunit beta' [Selenomonadaceae bacterium]|nr:DNA-directed RNA polymerase subunit beta' [Selenomonadaceae bacterium]
MRIGLASPEKIREWSHGEVKKPETINYRTLKPERDGLFCERIFGPTRDWECHCGKYKRIRYKGTICDRCGVEVTRAKVRRERMGHIELAAPVSHIWYFKGIPSRMGLLLDMSPRALERVLYFASYIVLDAGTTDLKQKDILTEGQYRLAKESYGRDAFKVGMGAEAIQKLLSELDLDSMSESLREELNSSNGQKRLRAIRRLEVVEAFRKSGNKPEWMILTVIPVIPPELRPMVQLDGGRFATSDLNDLYRRVINRNNRLRRLLNLKAPDIIVRNEKRMLQEAVDALIDNGRRGRPVTGPGNRALKSLSDMLKGKQGRFRQNLLGKRVDYSGRSVIVVGPELKLHQCGLPKEMALELFKPFVMKKLSADANLTIKAAKRKVDRANAEVWGVLEEVIKEHPVLLNRAPTLHRLGIQAFEPVLTEGRALKLHPLACTAYNADFDGDQMAIHLPLSAEAQAEARVLMLAANHILAPKDGKPIIVPTQDMVLGTYYLTKLRKSSEKHSVKGENKYFASFNEALMAYNAGFLDLQAEIFVRVQDSFKLEALSFKGDDTQSSKLVKTSLGRMIFNEKLPPELRHYQRDAEGNLTLGKLMNKKELGKLVAECFNMFGATKTAEVIDEVKRLGYHFACIAGMTVAISDVITPPAKKEIIAETAGKVKRVEANFNRGLLTDQERYKKVIALWEDATNRVADAMMDNMDEFNPIFMMADSGARGNKQQMRQLAGMRGLMADPSGKTIDLPITANFREGLSVSDYFISSHGARKGLADTALRTADSGYLTRRLVDVAQDVIVREDDCDIETINLTLIRAKLAADTGDALELLNEALLDRVIAEDIKDAGGEVVIPHDSTLDEDALEVLIELNAPEVCLRGQSLTAPNAASHSLVSETIKLGTRDAAERQELRENFLREIIGKELVEPYAAKIDRELAEQILDADDLPEIRIRHNNIRGIEVEAITEETHSGKAAKGVIEPLADRIIGRVLAENIYDENGELIARINEMIDESNVKKICAVRDKVSIRSVLTCKSPFGVCKKCYGRDLANQTEVEVGEAVGIIAAQSIGEPGTQLTMRTFHTGGVAGGDITQGLPRVEELFEARKPKNNAIIAEIDGVISYGVEEKTGLRTVIINPHDIDNQQPREYVIPYGIQPKVKEGDEIVAGTNITDGAKNPHDIMRICGLKETHRYLVKEVQKVYKSQGVEINDKHIEVMVRQMLHKVRIEDSGSTEFLPGEFVDVNIFEAENTRAIEEERAPAVAKPILLGITKASLATDSFLSAASFQETTRVLTDAAIKGKIDPLIGLKENVIIGKLIPAGTGMSHYRDLKVIDNEEVDEESAAE